MPTKGSLFFKIYIVNITFLFCSMAMPNYALKPFFVMLQVKFGILVSNNMHNNEEKWKWRRWLSCEVKKKKLICSEVDYREVCSWSKSTKWNL